MTMQANSNQEIRDPVLDPLLSLEGSFNLLPDDASRR